MNETTYEHETAALREALRDCAERMRAQAPALWAKPPYAGRILPLDGDEPESVYDRPTRPGAR